MLPEWEETLDNHMILFIKRRMMLGTRESDAYAETADYFGRRARQVISTFRVRKSEEIRATGTHQSA